MIENIRAHKKTLKQIVKFIIVGSVGAALELTIFGNLLKINFWHENYLLANLASFFPSNILCFFLQKYWTFRHTLATSWQEYFKYLFTTMLSLATSSFVLYIGVGLIGTPRFWTKFCGMALAAVMSFLINRRWTFH